MYLYYGSCAHRRAFSPPRPGSAAHGGFLVLIRVRTFHGAMVLGSCRTCLLPGHLRTCTCFLVRTRRACRARLPQDLPPRAAHRACTCRPHLRAAHAAPRTPPPPRGRTHRAAAPVRRAAPARAASRHGLYRPHRTCLLRTTARRHYPVRSRPRCTTRLPPPPRAFLPPPAHPRHARASRRAAP